MGKHVGEQYPSRWTNAFLREQHAEWGAAEAEGWACEATSCAYVGKHR